MFKIFVIQTKFNSQKCDNGIFNSNMGEEVVNKFKNIFDYFAADDNTMSGEAVPYLLQQHLYESSQHSGNNTKPKQNSPTDKKKLTSWAPYFQ